MQTLQNQPTHLINLHGVLATYISDDMHLSSAYSFSLIPHFGVTSLSSHSRAAMARQEAMRKAW